MASALEVRDRCAEPRADHSTVANLRRKHVVVDLVTVRTVATEELVGMEKDGFVDKLVLVVRLRGAGRGKKPPRRGK